MTKIQLRRDTSANWTSANPTPASGEPCFETDTGKLKIGNGTTAYNNLPYQGGGDIPTNLVTTDTAQTITGAKTIAANNLLNFKDSGSNIRYNIASDSLVIQSSDPVEIRSNDITLGGTTRAQQYNFLGGAVPFGRYTSAAYTITVGTKSLNTVIESSSAPKIVRGNSSYINIDSGNLAEQVGIVATALLKIDKTGLNQAVNTGTTLDLLNLLSLTDSADNIVTTAGKGTDQYALTSGVLKMFSSTYNDMTVDVRVTGTITGSANSAREFLIELQRSDETVIEKKSVVKVATNDISSRGIAFDTFTNTTTDPFISGGLKLILNNTSGQTVTITGMSVLIKSRWYN